MAPSFRELLASPDIFDVQIGLKEIPSEDQALEQHYFYEMPVLFNNVVISLFEIFSTSGFGELRITSEVYREKIRVRLGDCPCLQFYLSPQELLAIQKVRKRILDEAVRRL